MKQADISKALSERGNEAPVNAFLPSDKPDTEQKTERIQLVVTPTMKKRIDVLSRMDGKSRNSFICDILAAAMQAREDDYEAGARFFDKHK